jgi:hypothetical protein
MKRAAMLNSLAALRRNDPLVDGLIRDVPAAQRRGVHRDQWIRTPGWNIAS